jgi:hypothetical protein
MGREQSNSTDRGGRGKKNVVSVAFMGSTLHIKKISMDLTLRAQEKWQTDVLRPINK